jgi:protein-S-isoprenylcysteine O-methyltransferase Ste14
MPLPAAGCRLGAALMHADDPIAGEDAPSSDMDVEPDELATLRWGDWAVVAGIVLVLVAVAVVLWLGIQGGGEACGPVHQALGHC